jgi:hypothetical protein
MHSADRPAVEFTSDRCGIVVIQEAPRSEHLRQQGAGSWHIESNHRGVRIELLDNRIEHFKACPDAVADSQRHPSARTDAFAQLLTQNRYEHSAPIVTRGASPWRR